MKTKLTNACPILDYMVSIGRALETSGRELDGLAAPDEFSVDRYLVAISGYTALHLWQRVHPKELNLTGLGCLERGQGGLRPRDLEQEERANEQVKQLAEKDRIRQEKMREYMEKITRKNKAADQ